MIQLSKGIIDDIVDQPTQTYFAHYRSVKDVYKRQALISSEGEIVGVYRKTHIYPTEKQWSTAGNKAEVFETPFGKIGIVICYDGDYPELCRVMAIKGCLLYTSRCV